VTLAFLGAYAAIVFGRSLWLGEPLTIPIHRLQSGLLLQFAFNMISDPKTTPDSRAGRVLFGALVALGAGVVQFMLFRTSGPVWSLAIVTLAVPLIDRLLPGPRYQWRSSIAGTAGTVVAGGPSTRNGVAATAGIHPNGSAGPAPRSHSVPRRPAAATS
jgi:Na+-translocating ferredoxin:NAD+ oxidoreductase RnfD subunit